MIFKKKFSFYFDLPIVFALALILSTCSIDVDIGARGFQFAITYNDLKTRPYMSGSVLYISPVTGNHNLGHLQNGKLIAVRLGRVTATGGSYKHSDNDNTVYAIMQIVNVSDDAIKFYFGHYGESGKYTRPAEEFNIANGESADLNGDGFADISYGEAPYNRPGMSRDTTRYLTFKNSKEKRVTSMFSVLPEQYGGTYPNGLIGINDNGSFIAYAYKYKHDDTRRSGGLFIKYKNSGNDQDIKNKSKNTENPNIDERQNILALKKGDYIIEKTSAGIPAMNYVYAGFHSGAIPAGYDASGSKKTLTHPLHSHLPGDDDPNKINDDLIYEDMKLTTDDYHNDLSLLNETWNLLKKWIEDDVVLQDVSLPNFEIDTDANKTNIVNYFNKVLTNINFIKHLANDTAAAAFEPKPWDDMKQSVDNDILSAYNAGKKGELALLTHAALHHVSGDNYFPILIVNPRCLTQALPQFFLNIASNYNRDAKHTYSSASSYADYMSQKDYNYKLKTTKKMYTFDTESIYTNIKTLSGDKIIADPNNQSTANLALGGSVSSTWGNIDIELFPDFYTVIEMDLLKDAQIDFNTIQAINLTDGFTIREIFGPLVIDMDIEQIDIDLNMIFTNNQIQENSENYFMGIAMSLGAKTSLGVNYNVDYKWGFVPDSHTFYPYFGYAKQVENEDGSKYQVLDAVEYIEVISYLGGKNTGKNNFTTPVLKFSPAHSIKNKISLWPLMGGEFYTTLEKSGNFNTDGGLKIDMDAAYELDLDVSIWHNSRDLSRHNFYKYDNDNEKDKIHILF
ncbi:hypothetical protein FACS1894102_1460 [Spirochaetia bacterium]|nr:hypothetical protein FACS1894102_1460 [Spirochaetia bacterium]